MDVSVVIPTYNRRDSLSDTLASLSRQTWSAEQVEVIVVDDGSTDGTAEIVREAYPFTLRCIRQRNQGSAAARNRGAQASRGNILIFVDDDMVVEPEYVSGLLEEHAAHNRIVCMGTCYLDYTEHDSVFARIIAGPSAAHGFDGKSHFVDFTDCVTNNLSVEREAFFEIGMMQDVAGDGPTWWGDVDFGYRAVQKGFRFRRSGRAICYHRDHAIRDLNIACGRAKKTAEMAVLLFHKYPELQPHIPMFRDKTPISLRHDAPRLTLRKAGRALTAWRPVLWQIQQLTRLLERLAPHPALLRRLYRWTISSHIYRGYRQGLREYGPVPVEGLS